MSDDKRAERCDAIPESHGREDQPFVRNADDKRSKAAYSLTSAFANAGAGFAFALRTQRNMKIHLAIVVAAVVLGVAFSITPLEWIAVVICVVAVFALECVNTAIESVVDLVSPGYHDLAKHAKDCAAAAVFVAAIGSVVVEAVILLPRVASLLF